MRLKNVQLDKNFIPRKPFSFNYEYCKDNNNRRNYCDYLKRPGNNNEDIVKEGLYDYVWGRTYWLEKTNHLGLHTSCFLKSICPEFPVAAEYEEEKMPEHIRTRLIGPSGFRSFKFNPIESSFKVNGDEIELEQIRRDYYWQSVFLPEKKIFNGRVRSTAQKVEYENCRPDMCEAYFAAKGVELKQEVSLFGEVAVLRQTIINNTDKTAEIEIDYKGNTTAGFEELLEVEPAAVSTKCSDKKVDVSYNSFPLTGFNSIVRFSENTEILECNDTQYAWRTSYKLKLEEGKSRTFSFLYAFGFNKENIEEQLSGFADDFSMVFKKSNEDWNNFFNLQVPQFSCSDEMYEKLYYWSFYCQRFNLDDFYWDADTNAHVCPRRGVFHGGFWWDSTFHAIVCKWLKDPTLAWNTIFEIDDDSSRVFGTTGIGIRDVLSNNMNDKMFKKAISEMEKICEIQKTDDHTGNGLPALNTRIWDYPYRWEPSYNGKTGLIEEQTELIDRCSLVALDYKILAELYIAAGEDEKATNTLKRYDEIKAEINKRMWSDESGFYHDCIENSGEKYFAKANAAFISMLAEVPDNEEKIKSLLSHLKDENEFNTPLRIPTLSKSTEGYNPKGYWYGCVWPPMNWMIIEGVAKYDEMLASELIHEWIGASIQYGYPSNFENMSSAGERQYKSLQAWGALPVDFIIRRIMGIVPRLDKKLEFNPFALNTEWDEASISNIELKGYNISVKWNANGSEKGYRIFIDDKEIVCLEKPDNVILEKCDVEWQRVV